MSDATLTSASPQTPAVGATIRLQFHSGFTLWDAAPLVSYFADLGITHIYASPLLTARAGSGHGYDVVDPTRVNPELGGEPALQQLVAELRDHGMGLLLDVVSNHMAVGGHANPWWLDVMEWGEASRFARFFDIIWQSPDPLLNGKVLAPFLSTDYGEVLAAGGITLQFNAESGSLYVAHYDHQFPLHPPSYAQVLNVSDNSELQALAQAFAQLPSDPEPIVKARKLQAELAHMHESGEPGDSVNACLTAFDVATEDGENRLHSLLEQQHFRLASWRTAADDINWRRFFDINELGGLRVEDPVVFDVTHEKTLEMVQRGWVDGLRIDHVDGLAEPRAYCRKLRRRAEQLSDAETFPIYVEKILAGNEQLPQDWQVTGTTGYEFMNQVSLVLHDPEGEAPLREWWHAVSGRPADFMAEVYPARKFLLASALAADRESVALGILQIARADRQTRDLTLGSIRRALTELVAHFPVYRTYAGACGRSAADQHFFNQALDAARSTLGQADWNALTHLDRWLGAQALKDIPPGEHRELRQRVLTRFQQLTSPAAAKAVEDTACYRAGVLLSRYDVGFDAENFSASVADFHQQCLERAHRFPHTMLTTASHDNKRGEDVRARLAVLSECATWFREHYQQWHSQAAALQQELSDGVAPTPGDEAILYQTLLGSWPLELLDASHNQQAALETYLQRLLGWQQKALREAKLRTSWHAVNTDYERACADFLTRLLTAPEGEELRTSIAAAAAAIAPTGALNGLTQTLLRMTTPGVPDLYQGNEFWDFNLVDPDNRRAVDFDARREALAEAGSTDELLVSWHNGRIKQRVIQQTLHLRKTHSALFLDGVYLPLQTRGQHAGRIIAFARQLEDKIVIVVVPVRCAGLTQDNRPFVNPAHWQDTFISLPDSLHRDVFHGVLSPGLIHPVSQTIAVTDVLGRSPVNILSSMPPSRQETSL